MALSSRFALLQLQRTLLATALVIATIAGFAVDCLRPVVPAIRPKLVKDCHSLKDAKANGIRIRKTKSKGLGAFAFAAAAADATTPSSSTTTTTTTTDGSTNPGIVFESGCWIGEYKGELHTRTEVESRYQWETKTNSRKNHNKKSNTKVDVRRWRKSRKNRHQGLSGDYLFDMGDGLFLDGEDTDVSSWCRFMNHAPETVSLSSGNGNGDENNGNDVDDATRINNSRCNVETKCSRLSYEEDGTRVLPVLWFVARRDILSGEELLYDYGDSYWEDAEA